MLLRNPFNGRVAVVLHSGVKLMQLSRSSVKKMKNVSAEWMQMAICTNSVHFVSDGGTPGSTVLYELTRDFHPVLSPSCVAEDQQSERRVPGLS